MSTNWLGVSRDRPCELCGKSDRCARSTDGNAASCFRTTDAPIGWTATRSKNVFRRDDRNGHRPAPTPEPAPAPTAAAPKPLPWSLAANWAQAKITDAQVDELAGTLGVSVAALRAVGIGWAAASELERWRAGFAGTGERPDGAFVFPERDGTGQIVGLSLRAPDGKKGAPSGARRGVIVPATIKDARPEDVVLIVEGASDVAALHTLGLIAVGRPSNSGGADDLARLLTDRPCIVLGENDAKETGAWPGRDGAKSVAQKITQAWQTSVRIAFPPSGAKDVRQWLGARIAAGLNLADSEARRAAGVELLAHLEKTATELVYKKRVTTQADAIARMVGDRYRLGQSLDRQAFAVPIDGPNIGMMFRSDRDRLRSAIARDYRAATGKTPGASAIQDALVALEGIAFDAAPEGVYLRIVERNDEIVIDLGDELGRAVVVDSTGWRIADMSPVLFRRTALTSPLPIPESGGSINELREILNVADASWPLLVGWLVAAYFPNIPHAILMLGGEQGTGKTSCARTLLSLFDASPAPTRTLPRDIEQWCVAASGSYGVCVDNVSGIPEWFSDALCRASTGEGLVKRQLYSDSSPVVLAFRRVLVLTAIDPGAIRGDLGDRVVLVDLERIDPTRRRTEKDLDAKLRDSAPRIFGAILDVVAEVIRELPNVKLNSMPRMGDFSVILAAVDAVLGSDAFARFEAQRDSIAQSVLEADPVGVAIRKYIDAAGGFHGTATELYGATTPQSPARGWPADGQRLGGRLRRIAPALRSVGIVVEFDKTGRARSRMIHITRPEAADGTAADTIGGGSGGYDYGRCQRPPASASVRTTEGVLSFPVPSRPALSRSGPGADSADAADAGKHKLTTGTPEGEIDGSGGESASTDDTGGESEDWEGIE